MVLGNVEMLDSVEVVEGVAVTEAVTRAYRWPCQISSTI